MNRRSLSFATAPYDRTLPLFDGRVQPEGIDLNVILLRYEDTFWRQLRHAEFDASEMSLSSYLMSKEQGPDLVAIPVFLSRVFRHSSIYINARAGITKASDLRGKKVGVPEYQMTAALWIRGILQDEYGVRPQEVEWFNGGLDEPGRVEKLKLNLPKDIRLSPIPSDKTLNAMLVAGELDALITARAPSAFLKADPAVARLFKDYKSEEIAYWQKTKIFPPMHIVAIRRDVYERDRWIAQSLYKAFVEAKKYCTPDLMFDGHLRYSLPFLHAAVDENKKIFGDTDPWAYGVAPNRHILEAATRYSHEHGLTSRRYTIEELFAPEAMDDSRN